jgi:cyclopropane fatty-acyl-phospholipid synthase-like methyltransferase
MILIPKIVEIWAYGFFSIIGILISYYLGVFEGAHYMPTTNEIVIQMLTMAELKPGDKLVDIGSGDGRILIAAAQQGIESVGYEINPLLVLWSRSRIKRAGMDTLARVYIKNFWGVNFSEFSVVMVYGIPHIMSSLEKKLDRELKPGARILCNSFPLPSKSRLGNDLKEGSITRYSVK